MKGKKEEIKKEGKKEVKIQTKKERKLSSIKDEKKLKKDSHPVMIKNKIDNTKTQPGNPFGVSLKKIPK